MYKCTKPCHLCSVACGARELRCHPVGRSQRTLGACGQDTCGEAKVGRARLVPGGPVSPCLGERMARLPPAPAHPSAPQRTPAGVFGGALFSSARGRGRGRDQGPWVLICPYLDLGPSVMLSEWGNTQELAGALTRECWGAVAPRGVGQRRKGRKALCKHRPAVRPCLPHPTPDTHRFPFRISLAPSLSPFLYSKLPYPPPTTTFSF